MPIIELHQVNKYYRTSTVETRALRDIDLRIEAGEMLGVTGRSGSGKSTLLNVLGLIESPSSGSYRFQDQEVSKLSDAQLTRLRREHFGFIFQNFNLIDQLSVYENVELPLKYLKCNRAQRRERVMEILRQLDMDHRAQHFPHQISGGQQQRTAIARAVVARPRLILADEPTGNLDSENGAAVLAILQQLNRELGSAIVLITHDDNQAALCHKQVQLHDGQLQQAMAIDSPA